MEERLTVSVSEAARLLGISKNSAYNACATKDIPSLKIGKRIVVPLAALDKLLSEGRKPEAQQPVGCS